MSWPERVWGDRAAPFALARAALAPMGAAYGVVMRVRRALYDRGILSVESPALPVISVGNLTVGGTGKTPVAAWVASRLCDRARPAIVLRGYGSDEVEVHRRLNPGIPLIANADRLAAVREAHRMGADVVVADDAFQHRRLGRVADIVLVSAEQMRGSRHCLPAGPWRESLDAARAADLILITRKSASSDEALATAELLQPLGVRTATIHLAPDGLVDARSGGTLPITGLRDRDVLAIAAIGNPAAFSDQLSEAGARPRLAAFRDHHEFTVSEALSLAHAIPAGGLAICTLKDAVKLAPLWPASTPLWYVSQQVVVEQGAEHVDQLLGRVLAARPGTTNTAG